MPRMTPEEVKEARLTLGLTQQGLADALELESQYSRDTVRSWESGSRPILGPERVAIALMLKLHKLNPPKPKPAPPPVVKRPRGRPRKNPVEATA